MTADAANLQLTQDVATPNPATAEPREPCPSPLAWQQVLAAFRAESEPWELDRGAYRLHGRTWGSGPPIYFLNGFGGTHELYALTVWLLREQFRCVLYDYPRWRSSGGSSRPTVSDFTADLFAIADLHGDERFSVYGSSFGSVIGLAAALDQPRRVERLILQNAFARRRLSVSERLLTIMCGYSSRRLRDFRWRTRFQQLNHRTWFPPFDFSRWQFLLDDTGQVPVAELAQRAAMLNRVDLRANLPNVTQPVLIVRAEGEGRLAEQCQNELEKALPNVRGEWLHSTGQLPFLTHPHRLAKLMRTFLTEQFV